MSCRQANYPRLPPSTVCSGATHRQRQPHSGGSKLEELDRVVSSRPNKRLKLAGGDRSKGHGVLCAGAHELTFKRHGARRTSRPQLKRDPLGASTAMQRATPSSHRASDGTCVRRAGTQPIALDTDAQHASTACSAVGSGHDPIITLVATACWCRIDLTWALFRLRSRGAPPRGKERTVVALGPGHAP